MRIYPEALIIAAFASNFISVSGFWGRKRRIPLAYRLHDGTCQHHLVQDASIHLQFRGGADGSNQPNENVRYPTYNQGEQLQQSNIARQQSPPIQQHDVPIYETLPPNGRYNEGPPPPQQQQQQQQQQSYVNGPYGPSVNSESRGNYQYPLPPPPLPDQYIAPGPYSNNMDPNLYANIEEDDLVPPSGVESMPVVPWDTTSSSRSSTILDEMAAFNKDYILKGLARLYQKKILPIELASKYGHFHSPPLSPSDFDAPPMILLLGQYSVGKTSFIKYLLGRDFPGIRVGPEPTTDRFTAILWGSQDKIIPGAALCSQTDRPFTGLSPFGNNFLSRMEAAELDSPILKNVTIIDTPGILSGQKQRSRNYDYEAVMKWFAERADLIIVMFDAHKLDISDELKDVITLMIPYLDKIRIVLNKADSISTQQLLRVYGALMWSLGKVMNTPEVSRVYVGSFWDVPLQNTEQAELLQREEMDLLYDITTLPQQAVMRRINELVKRARSVKVHAYIIHYLRKQMPYNPWAKKEKQKRLIGRLENEFKAAARRYGLPVGDFPAPEPMRRALNEIKDIGEFPKLDKKRVREMDRVFSVDVPELLERAKNQ